MTAISAEKALDYLRLLATMHVTYPESTDYRRGAVDLADSFALYLEALIEEPAAEREVAA